MPSLSIHVLLCLCWGLATSAALDLTNTTDSTSKIREAVCKKEYSMTCLRLDIVGAVERMGGAAEYQLLPGVYFSHRLNRTMPPEGLLEEISRGNNSNEVDKFISTRINDYLSSLTLSVKVLDSVTVNHARKISEQILSHLVPAETGVAGRKKGGGLGGALWAAGSIAAVGLAALAAMSGKALMTSMLALMLAGAGVLRGGGGASSGGGGGGCGKETQYIHAVHGRNIEYIDDPMTNEETRPVFRPSEAYTFTQSPQQA